MKEKPRIGQPVRVEGKGRWFEEKNFGERKGRIMYVGKGKQSHGFDYLIDFTMKRRTYENSPFHDDDFNNMDEEELAWYREHQINILCLQHTCMVWHDKREEYFCPFCEND